MATALGTEVGFTTPTIDISPIRISTMVTTCHIDTQINLAKLHEQIQICPYWDLTDGVLKMEFHTSTKGISWKDLMQKPEKTSKTFFFNQATLVIRREIAPLQWKEINIKLFRNGGVQMTGVRSEEMSLNAITWLIDYIQKTCPESVFDGTPRIHKMQIQLVNTDFSIGAKIRRDALYKVISEKYHLTVSYEPSIYQGVKTKYFYNAERPATCPPGLCPCEKLCKGTGDGERIGQCKKITISPFQTGQVIITGARTIDQINDAYEFMKDVFRANADEVLRKNYICPDAGTGGKTDDRPSPASKSSGWIHHPSPKNIIRIESRKIQ
jgi:TATA-box binding protein (TBP) (component of TFIID and TFIIIB)